ncbi:MAG: histidine--tRNA ligase [Myxococcaceae bacterium]
MNDLLPGEIETWQHVEATARATFERYGYGEVRTPVVEDTALFVRSVGEATDIVGKEMYTFLDKANRSLTLRPEGTAPAARAYIEHAVQNQEPVTRWYYLGPMFRYERMKTGRYRQFWQVGVETYGVAEPAQDVEQMEMVMHLLAELGLKGISLNLNSLGDDACRPAYHERLVSYFEAHREELCAECKERLTRNPLRVLDCKNERCQELGRPAPSILESLCEPCRAHFAEVQRLLGLLGVKFELNPRLVRGLDYYTRTAFEFIAADPVLGTASAVGGGGRYDKLVRSLGGPEVPAVGFALGLDRLCLLVKAAGKAKENKPDLFLVTVDAPARDRALELATALRHQGYRVELDTRGGSVKSQMKRADKSGARFALVLGEKELAEAKGQLKPMEGGEPRAVALSELAQALAGA